MSIIERIYQLIEQKGISGNEFARKIDVSMGYLSKQKATNANIGSHILEKIVSVYPEVNIEWLVTGKGNMFNNVHYKTEEIPDLVKESTLSYDKTCTQCANKDQIISELLKQIDIQAKQIDKLINKLTSK